MKYAAAGATLLAGVEGVSALVNMNRAPEMGEESKMVTLEDWALNCSVWIQWRQQ